jgi:hypothetical protein
LLLKVVSTRTIIPYFRALTFSDDVNPPDIVSRLMTEFEKSTTPEPIRHEETLKRLSLCIGVCNCAEINKVKKNKLTTLLLFQWIGYFAKNSCWELCVTDSKDDDLDFLKQCCSYITHFITDFTFLRIGAKTSFVEQFLSFFDTRTLQHTGADTESLVPFRNSNKRKFGSDEMSAVTDGDIFDCLLTLTELFPILEMVLINAAKKYDISILGDLSNLQWIWEAITHAGGIMITYGKRIFSVSVPVLENDSWRRELLLLGSRYLEESESIFPYFGQSNPSLINLRVRYLLVAAAAKMDACEISRRDEIIPSESADLSVSLVSKTEKLDDITSSLEIGKRAASLVEMASKLLEKSLDFADEEEKELQNSAVILQFGCFSLIGDPINSENFILKTLPYLQSLKLENIHILYSIAESSKAFSLESLRLLLSNALKIAVSGNLPNIDDMKYCGWICRRLIQISSSRKQALEKIQEFEQLLLRVSKQYIVSEVFDPEDIDETLALAYNYGVTLIDLNQLVLAEQFLLKSLSLVRFASDSYRLYLPRMEVNLATFDLGTFIYDFCRKLIHK